MTKVSNVCGMFYGATKFNCDIVTWDVTNVKSMSKRFEEGYEGDVSTWKGFARQSKK